MIITEITGVASMFGCVCMLFVCAAQMKQLLEAARAHAPKPWEISQPAYAYQTIRKQAALF